MNCAKCDKPLRFKTTWLMDIPGVGVRLFCGAACVLEWLALAADNLRNLVRANAIRRKAA